MAYIDPYSSTYSLTLSDYLTYLGIPEMEKIPFFIQVVDREGNLQELFPDDPTIYALKLNINPTSASMNFARIVNRTQTMTGWVEEHWGEELDTITFQGSTAAFVVGARNLRGTKNGGLLAAEANYGQRLRRSFNEALGIVDFNEAFPSGNVGLTVENRRYSVSYLEMKKLLELMRTNACRFDHESRRATVQGENYETFGLITARNYIRIAHDFGEFLGYIESFDVTEDASTPYKFTYTITFKSEITRFNYLR